MTAKDKALNFTEKFIAPTMDRGLCGYFKSIAIAKECALIAVDEIIEAVGNNSESHIWIKVKHEIQNL